MLVGGLHLLQDTPQQVEETLDALANRFHVNTMAIGHCSGELTFLRVQQEMGEAQYLRRAGGSIRLLMRGMRQRSCSRNFLDAG